MKKHLSRGAPLYCRETYLDPDDCFLRLASPEVELRSGEISSRFSDVPAMAIGPRESDCRWVPFFGGRPSRLPDAVRFGPRPDFESFVPLKEVGDSHYWTSAT
jgi:hypothetical protein